MVTEGETGYYLYSALSGGSNGKRDDRNKRHIGEMVLTRDVQI
jgi:hypothetical protein